MNKFIKKILVFIVIFSLSIIYYPSIIIGKDLQNNIVDEDSKKKYKESVETKEEKIKEEETKNSNYIELQANYIGENKLKKSEQKTDYQNFEIKLINNTNKDLSNFIILSFLTKNENISFDSEKASMSLQLVETIKDNLDKYRIFYSKMNPGTLTKSKYLEDANWIEGNVLTSDEYKEVKAIKIVPKKEIVLSHNSEIKFILGVTVDDKTFGNKDKYIVNFSFDFKVSNEKEFRSSNIASTIFYKKQLETKSENIEKKDLREDSNRSSRSKRSVTSRARSVSNSVPGLSFIRLPYFNFGTHKGTGSGTYFKSRAIDRTHTFEFLDEGRKAQWNVYAKLHPFKNEFGHIGLRGTKIKMLNGKADTSYGGRDPYFRRRRNGISGILERNIVLEEGVIKKIASSKNRHHNQVKTFYQFRWDSRKGETVEIEIPYSSIKRGKYTGKIEWYLINGPI